MCPFTDERDTCVEARWLAFIRRHIIAKAYLTVLSNDGLFIQDHTIDHASAADNCIKEHDGVAYHRAILDNDARRKHAILDMPIDDATMGDQATRHLIAATHVCRWALFTTCMNDPGRIIEIKSRVVTEQFHVGLPV